MFQVSPSRQAHKLAIVALVLSKKRGDVVTKAEISAATKADERLWKSAVGPAKKALETEHNIVLEPVTKVGYRIASPRETAGIADRKIQSAHRKAKSASRVLGTVNQDDFKSLSKTEQATHVLVKTRVEIVKDVTQPRRLKELSTRVSNAALPSGIESLK